MYDFVNLARPLMSGAVELVAENTPVFAEVVKALPRGHLNCGENANVFPLPHGTWSLEGLQWYGTETDVLTLRGFERLDVLWWLAQHYNWGPVPGVSNHSAYVVERHRRGYTPEMLGPLQRDGLGLGFADDWYEVFAMTDLGVLFDAGFTGPEVRAVLDGEVFPDRDTLAVMTALTA